MKNHREVWRALALFTQMGLTMAACVLIGLLFGKWLDARLGSAPWFLLGMTLLGVVSAFFSAYKMAMKR